VQLDLAGTRQGVIARQTSSMGSGILACVAASDPGAVRM
jgi:hypothetical protein